MVDPGPHMVLQRCVIGRWKGYRTASFVALLEDGSSIAESSPFRARGGEPPARSDVTVEAYDAIVAQLVEHGWQLDVSADPAAWYASTFVREVEALPEEPDELEPDELEPEELEAEVLAPAVPAAVPTPAPAQAPPRPAAEPARAPVPAPAAAAQSEERTAPEPTALPARRRGARTPRIAAGLGLAAAAGLAVFVGLGHGLRHSEQTAAQTAQTAPRPRAARVHHVAPRPAAPPVRRTVAGVAHVAHTTPPVRVVHLVVSATTRSSWLEVHLGSAQGRILFAGELPVGRTLRLHGPKLWVRFGAAGNLAITSNGTPVRLQGTLEHTFVPRL